jgi:hypothetical protein
MKSSVDRARDGIMMSASATPPASAEKRFICVTMRP